MGAVKALGQNRVGEYGILWGDAANRDIADEYFTPDTQELRTIFDSLGKLPALYHHALDDKAKSAVIGQIDVMEPDDMGVWVEAQIDRNSEYAGAIRDLVDKGKLHWSSGSLPGAYRAADDGHIERWTAVEFSLTPSPAEYRMLQRPIGEIRAAYKAIGLEQEVRQVLPADGDDSPDADTPGGDTSVEDVCRARLGLLDLLAMEVFPTGETE